MRERTEASSKQKKPCAQLTAATFRGEGCEQKVPHGFHRSCISSGTKYLCDMRSSSFSQAGVPETAGQSLFGKAADFLLTVFPELLSHKKLSDARRETQNNVARSSTRLPTLHIALTDVQQKLSASIHKNLCNRICPLFSTLSWQKLHKPVLWGEEIYGPVFP